MGKLLHINASPREDASNTLKISKVFLQAFKERHPDWEMEELNLTKEEMPSLTVKRLDGKYTLMQGKELSGEVKEAWDAIVRQINRFLAADIYVISSPMWNFSIPYMLKHYIDVIVQPRHLFQYTPHGVEGFAKNKKMVVITSRGGDYSSEKTRSQDFQEPYLRTIFGFVGITDITFINAEPMGQGLELQQQKLNSAKITAKSLGSSII